MERVYDKACIASMVGIASTALAKAAERAHELGLLKLSDQILQREVDLAYLRRDLLEIPPKTTPQEQQLDVPF